MLKIYEAAMLWTQTVLSKVVCTELKGNDLLLVPHILVGLVFLLNLWVPKKKRKKVKWSKKKKE